MGKDNRNRSLFALQSDYGGAILFLEESAEIANMKMQYLARKRVLRLGGFSTVYKGRK